MPGPINPTWPTHGEVGWDTDLNTGLGTVVTRVNTHADQHASAGADPVTPAAIGAQPVDSDLTTIAALTAAGSAVIQESGGAWAARTPTQLAATLPADQAAGTASLRTLGTGATQAASGTDSRLSDARTPTAHSHPESDVTSLTADLAAKVPTSRQVIAGAGLTGGGGLSTDRTLAVVARTGSKHFYVSKGAQASDSNDGLSWATAFATCAAAFTAAAGVGSPGVIEIGVGAWTENKLVRPNGWSVKGAGFSSSLTPLTKISLTNGQNTNLLEDQYWGSDTTTGIGGTIEGLYLDGNKLNQTVHVPEALVTDLTVSLSAASTVTVNVDSTTGFATTGEAWFGQYPATYTGKTSTSFTGVQLLSGAASRTLYVECRIIPRASQGHCLAIQSARTEVRDVLCSYGMGSGVIIDSCSASPLYETKLYNVRCEYNDRYNFEFGRWSSDGMGSDLVGAGGGKGDMFVGSVDWLISNYHPTGAVDARSKLAPALVRICGSQIQIRNLFSDTAPYDTVLLDNLSLASQIVDIDIDGQLFQPSWGVAGGSAAVGMVANRGLTSWVAQRLRIRLGCVGRIETPLRGGPWTYSIGSQSLTTTPSKLQVLNALIFSPLGSSIAGTLTVNGSVTVSYTGRSMAAGALTTQATSGASSLVLDDATGANAGVAFAASGTVTAYPPDTSEAPVAAIQLAYTGVSGNTLTGVSGLSTTLPVGTSIAQHYLLGATVASGTTSVSNDTSVQQTNRAMPNISGEFSGPTSMNKSVGNYLHGQFGNVQLRCSGEVLEKPNPFYGTITITTGNSTGSVAHNLQNLPLYFSATPSSPVAYGMTVDYSNVTVTLASAAGSTITFAVMAHNTPS